MKLYHKASHSLVIKSKRLKLALLLLDSLKKESVADISTPSRAASKAQLDSAIKLVKLTGDIKKADTPELRNAIELLKEERTETEAEKTLSKINRKQRRR